MTEDPWTAHVEAFGRLVTGQRQLAKRTLRELSTRYVLQQVVATHRAYQRPVVESVRSWANAFDRAGLDGGRRRIGGGASTKDVIGDGFAIAEQMLRAQRAFAELVVTASRPASDRRA